MYIIEDVHINYRNSILSHVNEIGSKYNFSCELIDLTQNKAKLVFELPSASYKTFYGYSIKDYNNLFDGFKKATEEH